MKTSESTKSIFKALTEFKKDFKQPKKDTENPFFKSKYVDLDAVVDALDHTLPDYKLGYTQNVTTDENGRVGVQTIIVHDSGESIEFDWLFIKPDKQTAQGIGSAITYGRRYTLTSAFGIASEVDDDGNEASGTNNQNSQNKPPKKITTQQANTLRKVIKSIADLNGQTPEQAEKKLLELGKINGSLEDLNESQFGNFSNFLNQARAHYQKAEQTTLMDGNTTKAKGSD